MNNTIKFKEIIKQEWEKEYLLAEGQEPYELEDSIFSIYYELVERICVKVWNEAMDYVADRALIEEHIPEEERDLVWEEPVNIIGGGYIRNEHYVTVSKESITRLKINEQGTDTTEV